MEDKKRQANNIRLPVGKVLVQAFLVPWALRHELVRALSVPAISLIMLYISDSYVRDLGGLVLFVCVFISSVAYVLFAVTCHRVVLLGDQPVPRYGIIKWSMRETRFLFWLLGVYGVGFTIFALAAFSTTMYVAISEYYWLPVLPLLFLLILIPGFYVLVRLSLIFPATAVDQRPDIKWAWDRSFNNGWRLVVIVGLLPSVTSIAQELLERENSSIIEDALWPLMYILVLIVEISALSLSYKELNKHG